MLKYRLILLGTIFIGINHWVYGEGIFEAIKSRDIKKVKEVIAADPQWATNRFGGQPPLHTAIRSGDIEIVKLLLENQANPATTDNGNLESALHIAAAKGNKEMVELLLANKADVNAKSRDGSTPLHTAVTKYQKELVLLLIANQRRGQFKYYHNIRLSFPHLGHDMMIMVDFDISQVLSEFYHITQKPKEDSRRDLPHYFF